MQLFETMKDIQLVVMEMVEHRTSNDEPVVSRDQLLDITESRLSTMLHQINAEKDFLELGGIYFELLSHDHLVEFPEFLLVKHQEYGAEPLLISRVSGIIDRMLHKLARIRHLVSKGPEAEEHIQLEIQDLLGYSVLGYLFIKKFGI